MSKKSDVNELREKILNTNISILKNALLEILHVISFEGCYRDQKFIIQTLQDAGVSQEDVVYHLKVEK